MVDTAFSYGRALIFYYFFQESFKVKKVVCIKSQVLILRFYIVGQKYHRLSPPVMSLSCFL